ncbi:hypothetical protein JCGZ_03230 [Jatropha curcas]|uniref:Aminotransferase-like plant mobile domain-containing protein n=1 Tax=Jatropha curcas TaxID=180498 RepID=A0A067L9C2_JATCU|nr:hypothetical protein JCGZ_03230 [Jatropha curcas]
MEQWMDTIHTFYVLFDEMTITPINFAAIMGLFVGGRSVVFDDKMRTLDRLSLQASHWNHGNDTDLALLPPLWDLDAPALSYLYYDMNLCVRGVHLKVGYKRVIGIWACEHKVLPMPCLFGFEGGVNIRTLPRGRGWQYSKRYSHTTSDVAMFQQLLNGLSWD